MEQLIVAVVLPSFNEERTILETCKSLGFSGDATTRSEPNTFLFIVDNGSTDKTLELAHQLQLDSPAGSVIIGREEERGYVPPRHKGNTLVTELASHHGLDPSDILVLQADADTQYDKGYIENMRSASMALGPNLLLEGLAEFPLEFRESFPEYVDLSRNADKSVLSILDGLATGDIMCTDAVCGYRLSDYFYWGGHSREYLDTGDEIYAETTRLYMRSVTRGARKVYVEEARAFPSQRKVISRPAREFATAGFPREASWMALWDQQFPEALNIRQFSAQLSHPETLRAIHLRAWHLIALFGLLPLHVNRALGNDILPVDTPFGEIASSLPRNRLANLSSHPGTLLADVLTLVDLRGDLLDKLLTR